MSDLAKLHHSTESQKIKRRKKILIYGTQQEQRVPHLGL